MKYRISLYLFLLIVLLLSSQDSSLALISDWINEAPFPLCHARVLRQSTKQFLEIFFHNIKEGIGENILKTNTWKMTKQTHFADNGRRSIKGTAFSTTFCQGPSLYPNKVAHRNIFPAFTSLTPSYYWKQLVILLSSCALFSFFVKPRLGP